VKVTEKWVTASDFERRLGWSRGTGLRKLYKTREKVRRGQRPTPDDIPLPEDDTIGAPRWTFKQLDDYARDYIERNGRRRRVRVLPTVVIHHARRFPPSRRHTR
jgi:hypothetical protein